MNRYFSTESSHMWLPYKGKNNQILVLSESSMKHNVTSINGKNKLLASAKLMFGNCLLETKLGCYPAGPIPTPPYMKLWLLPCPADGNETCTLHCTNSSSKHRNNSNIITNTSHSQCTKKLWAIYFEGSKSQDDSGVWIVSIDPYNKKHLVSSHLEFECMNNIVEYEALMLGLQKSISLNVVMLKVVGDSEIVVW